MDQSTIYLNRPARVNEPNSSNQSNGEWRRNKKVIRAQSEYDERLNLKEFSDKPSLTDHLQDVALSLPINCKQKYRERRFLDIQQHHATQLLFGVEFDLQHLPVKKTGQQNQDNEGYEDPNLPPFMG